MAGIGGLTGWIGTALSARDPHALAQFYSALLGWEIGEDSPEWVTIRMPGTTHYLAFAVDEHHEPPAWPSRPDEPTMQAHLDVGVSDLAVAVEDAVSLGATVAAYQPQDDVRVMLDPAGHPFCLYLDD
ncbi:MAG TPA: VOC family protein [Marmoricola sp.]|nr:VOC family protein [Marmoricola sp.]